MQPPVVAVWEQDGDHPSVLSFESGPLEARLAWKKKCLGCGHKYRKHGWLVDDNGVVLVCPGAVLMTGPRGRIGVCSKSFVEAIRREPNDKHLSTPAGGHVEIALDPSVDLSNPYRQPPVPTAQHYLDLLARYLRNTYPQELAHDRPITGQELVNAVCRILGEYAGMRESIHKAMEMISR